MKKYGSGGKRNGLLAFATAVAVALHPGAANGQIVLPYPYQFFQPGSWSVPYVLAVEDGLGEIVHLALLPPAIDKTGIPWVTVDAAPRVFLSCVPGVPPSFGGPPYGLSYLWNPDRPGRAVMLIPPHAEYPIDGSEDFFCGGHAFLFDGRFLFVNGTDSYTDPSPCMGPVGHDGAWVLDTHNASPAWIKATSEPTNKPFPRWYSTATALGDKTIIVHGHTGCPAWAPPPEPPETFKIDAFRDRFTWNSAAATGTWGEVIGGLHPGNAPLGGANTCNAVPATKIRLFDYPQLHLASTGELVWPPARLPGSPSAALNSLFMNVEVPDCPTSSAPLRWRPGEESLSVPQLHIDGSSVQLITWDKNSGDFTETFYLIGGADKGISGDPCDCDGATVSSAVQKMTRVLPQFGVDPAWDDGVWQPVDSLNAARVNHNTTILLDGSLLVNGGMACSAAGGATCNPSGIPYSFTYSLSAERYMPLEVLDNPPGALQPEWVTVAAQERARGYHSTSVAEPGGGVVSAGGKAEDAAYHSAEIYTPGWGQVVGLTRPAIDAEGLLDPANNAYRYNFTFTFNVTLAPNRTVNRVALIRNGSSTHAFNPDQRYVELARDPDEQLLTPPNTWKLTVLAPLNGNRAPPGYYGSPAGLVEARRRGPCSRAA